MKKKIAFTTLLFAAALALTWPGKADQRYRGYSNSTDLPAPDVVTAVRARGFNPLGRPVRRGDVYLLHALDQRGLELSIVADVATGELIAVTPARASASTFMPRYDNSPRIIHVPQNGGDARGALRGNDIPADEEASVAPEEDDEIAPPVRRRIEPLPRQRSDAPPPPSGPKRAVLSAPPPLPEGPSPVKPTPRWRSSEKFVTPAEKLAAPADKTVTPVEIDSVAAAASASTHLPIGTESIPGEAEYTPPAVQGD